MDVRPPPDVHFEATPEWFLVRARGEHDVAWLEVRVFTDLGETKAWLRDRETGLRTPT